ncbi:MAG: response regulator [Acidobacteria bacterium]|nr:response regulator [Acidobacteriota bacterium]
MKSDNIKVLLIDDDVDDFILTRELFSMVNLSNYTLDWAASYEEGLKIVECRKHDVCLVDYRLGERNGVDLIREARESRLTTPMILLTGQNDYDVDVEAMEAGATDFLVKDETSPARLERTIRYAVALNIERCRAEEALRAEREYFGHIISAAPTVIVGITPEGTTTFVNQAIRQVAGYEPDELIGRDWWRVLYPDEEYRQVERLLKDFEHGAVVNYEMELTTKNGEKRCVSWNSVNRLNEHNELVEIIGIGNDITEQVLSRRRLETTEDQLRQSQKLESVGMLAGGIAHDFNNLLTVITGYSELMLRRLDKVDPLARNVEEIKKAAERATSLTRQLLAFSRKQVLQPKVLDLNSVVANIEKMLGRLVGEDMELRTSPGAGLGQVKADPGQIEQVILNLVVNARDAMPKGGKITIETANVYLDNEYAREHIAIQPGWYAMLAVTDTGCGMDAETQKYIFEPFFTTKEQGKGTGLGLSTVYGIVKQSGGNIWAYSEVGVGTTFKIYLPLVNEQVSEPEPDAARPEKVVGTETILLAEDEEMVRNLARESLKMHGYTVLTAANAGEALLICQQHVGTIHLLMTDVVMPRMSGKELAEQLLRLRPETRVLYMSGYAADAIVHHGILDKDIAFIGKPFTPDALVLKVVEVLQQDRSSFSSL